MSVYNAKRCKISAVKYYLKNKDNTRKTGVV